MTEPETPWVDLHDRRARPMWDEAETWFEAPVHANASRSPALAFAFDHGNYTSFLITFGGEAVRVRFPWVREVATAAIHAADAAPPPWNVVNRLRLVHVAQALRLADQPVDGDVEAILARWTAGLVFQPVSSSTTHHWNSGLAALWYGARARYRAVAGLMSDEPLPFDPDARPGPNMQGHLATIAAAVEAGRTDVGAWWQHLIAWLPTLTAARAASPDTVLLLAQLVYMRVGGLPPAAVIPALRADLRR